jgi:hypothetical protein
MRNIVPSLKKRKNLLVIWILILSLIPITGCVTITLNNRSADKSIISVPVEIQNAGNIGSIEFELIYDENILTATNVVKGKGMSNILMEYNTDSPGSVLIGAASLNGFSGDNTLVTVTFKIRQSTEAPVTLALANVTAYSLDSMEEMPSDVTNGDLNPKSHTSMAPSIVFNTQ